MLSLEQIKQFYPDELRGFERFMLREYLQYKILEILFQSSYASMFVFIGGTSLRIVHGNERFSEDLDFDNPSISAGVFNEVAKAIRDGLQLEGYQVDIRSIKKSAYHCYIRFPKLLYQAGLSGHEEEKILIRLDTEAQYFNFQPERFILNKFDVFTEINVTPPDVLLAHKFLTILERKQSKGRDFYDVVFLLGKNIIPNYEFLNQKASVTSGKQLKEAVLDRIKAYNMLELAEDVRPFLIKPRDAKKVVLFRELMEQSSF
jgi:predicted nucleotidyltransferase component of viral defense system